MEKTNLQLVSTEQAFEIFRSGDMKQKCNKAKRRGPQYSSNIHLLYHVDSDKVTVYKTEAAYNHHDDKVLGIDENVKKWIEELYNNPIMKPKQIIRARQSR
ncbi:unnamed protein product [Didymodactylos carnosus]|uniref:Uncharacterized protein n=2 Tax=Didymodactylos carnosus TaxID=1234261 RepID=A0A8S2DJI7_9BILA|nr:unnamed protein product [Didymodactylos carnosus]CAF3687737.1 unnamed protein product [Didymodactylos carnosus]